jgi:hypothetical protein
VNDQLFFGEKLERAVPFHVNRVSKVAVICWEHGDHSAGLMVVCRFVDLLANRKLRHRELLLESSVRLYLHKLADRFLTISYPEFRTRLLL